MFVSKRRLNDIERLTARNKTGVAYSKIPLNESYIPLDNGKVGYCYTGFVADRLTGYEETGLNPEEIMDIVTKYNKTQCCQTCPLDSMRWQPVSNPPKENGEYLCADRDVVFIAEYKNGYWSVLSNRPYSAFWTPQYWQPKPQPPKGEE